MSVKKPHQPTVALNALKNKLTSKSVKTWFFGNYPEIGREPAAVKAFQEIMGELAAEHTTGSEQGISRESTKSRVGWFIRDGLLIETTELKSSNQQTFRICPVPLY